CAPLPGSRGGGGPPRHWRVRVVERPELAAPRRQRRDGEDRGGCRIGGRRGDRGGRYGGRGRKDWSGCCVRRNGEDRRAVLAFRRDHAVADLDADLRSGLLLVLDLVEVGFAERRSGKNQGQSRSKADSHSAHGSSSPIALFAGTQTGTLSTALRPPRWDWPSAMSPPWMRAMSRAMASPSPVEPES